MKNIALTPITIGGVTIKNRIFRPPHQMHLCAMGRVTDALIAYHEARAEGGTGLIILEAAPVHWASAQAPDVLTIWDDEAIDGLARLAERLESHGAKTFIQLLHAGFNGMPRDGSPPWGPSSFTGYMPSGPALEMTRAMIDEVIECYASAAQRAVQAGLHGVEIHAVHGYLPRQFLAQAMNGRTDDYGGSFENRSRFLMEVMRAVRKAVPAHGFAVGMRLGPDVDEGLSDIGEIEKIVQLLEEEDLVDFHDMSLAATLGREALGAASMARPAGYQLEYLDGINQRTAKPVLVTGRFRTIEEAGAAIRAGDAEMVGMVRAQIADPHIVKKTLEGRTEEIRPCIACNQRCVAGIAIGDVGCAVNPGAGHETQLGDHRIIAAGTRRKIVVVGGGVGGMEAARVAALRGHDVTLHEAQPDLGGTVRIVSKTAPKMGAFGDITYWLESEIRRLGVEVATSSYLDSGDLGASNADAVIVATGSRPRADGFNRFRPGHKAQGVDLPHVMSTIDLLTNPNLKPGAAALVWDDEGHYEAIAACEYLVEAGLDVVYATRHPSFAPLMDYAMRSNEAYARLARTGRFTVRARAMLDSIGSDFVELYDPSVDARPEVIPADIVILVGHNASNNDLLNDAAAGKLVIGVGDALSPRYVEHAIREGHLAGLRV